MIRKKKYDYELMFQMMAESGRSCAVELLRILKDFHPEAMEAHLQKMHRIEHDADQRKHDVLSALAKDSRPLFEHEDIAALANALDDVVDFVEDVSIGLYIYHVTEIREGALAYGKVIVKCCDALCRLIQSLDKMEYNEKLEDSIRTIHLLEDEGDQLFAKNTRETFSGLCDPIEALKWKSIYDRMERACDACEEVGHLIESMSMKYV